MIYINAIMVLACSLPAQIEQTEFQKLVSADPAPGDQFGASVSIGLGTMVVSIPHDDEVGVQSEGAVLVFEKIGGAWVETAKLKSPNPASKVFGRDVLASGTQIMVGCAYDAAPDTIHVFRRSGAAWVDAQVLTPSTGVQASFGRGRDLDGPTAVFGTPGEVVSGNSNAGAAYVFEEVGTSWTETARLLPASSFAHQSFGRSIALEGDTLLVGAPTNSALAGATGQVHVFRRSVVGGVSIWNEVDVLGPSDGQERCGFGGSLSVDSGTLIVGARAHDNQGVLDNGAVYVFQRIGTSWIEQQVVLPPVASQRALFGSSTVVMGGQLVISAPYDDQTSVDGGSVYVYSPSSPGAWSMSARLAGSDTAQGDVFGWSLSGAPQGIIVGARQASFSGLGDAGAAYVFSAAAACAPCVLDKVTKDLVEVSSTPKGGALLPLGAELFVDAGARVGLGTTTPQAKLDIRDANATFLFDGSASTRTYSTTFSMDDSGLTIGHDSANHKLDLVTQSLPRVTVDQLGNVGVGIDPVHRLDVVGGGTPDSVSGGVVSVTNSGTANSTAFLSVQSGAAGWAGLTLGDPTDGDQAGLKLLNGPEDRLVLTNHGEQVSVLENGQVGIGTLPDPGTKVDIRDDSTSGAGRTILTLRTAESIPQTAGWLDWAQSGSITGRVANGYEGDGQFGLWFYPYDGGLSSTPALHVSAQGRVGIGIDDPETQKIANILTVAQDSPTDPIADAWTCYSSERWKDQVAPIASALEKAVALRGVTFRWKASGDSDLGLIAEEVARVLPEAVGLDSHGDPISVDYGRVTAVLVEAVEELERENEHLRDRLASLEVRLSKAGL